MTTPPLFDDIGASMIRPSPRKGVVEGVGYRFYHGSCLKMPQCANESIALTVTSPPYWNAIDYDIHTEQGGNTWHRQRKYTSFGDTFDEYLSNIRKAFKEVYRATIKGGFCAIVAGTILHNGKHYPAPMMITSRMLDIGWEFHQDIIWNKVTGGVKRAGSFIQNPKSGYYYPNIMTEYILIFRKAGKPRRDTKQALDIDDLFKRDIANNVWHIAPVPPKQIDHPCPFPEELVRRLVLLYSQEDDEVLDNFLGSGQTAIAAIKQNRRCVGYDVELSYLHLAASLIAKGGHNRNHNLIPRFDTISYTH